VIYFDNAATTFPKPAQVVRRVTQTLENYSANPGRSGHRLAMEASEAVFDCRSRAAAMFGLDDPSRVIFTSNATQALNLAIRGYAGAGDRIVTSSMEHNSVARPCFEHSKRGGFWDTAEVCIDSDDRTVAAFERLIRDDTRLVIATHVSNVFGNVLPVERIAAVCRKKGVLFMLDASQSAGSIDIDMKKNGIDILCAPGHKGLYGPQGTGLLIINTEKLPRPIISGGTGSGSADLAQPDFLPDRLESGTLNVAGIAGLAAGIGFISGFGNGEVMRHELALSYEMKRALSDIAGVRLYDVKTAVTGLFSFNIEGVDCERTAQELNAAGVAVRAGLHCSPLAHRTMGTLKTGTVRVSPGVFNTMQEAERLCTAVKRIAENTGGRPRVY